LLLITVDHGESFEKGFLGHAGPALHEALIRIPLLVRLPGQRSGRIIDTPVSQADLAPSILDFVGAAPLPRGEGRSLAPSWRSGEAPEAHPVFAMAMERQSRFQPLSQGHFALLEPRHKLVLHLPSGVAELFDLQADPEERRDLAAEQPAEAARMTALLQRELQAAEQRRQRAHAP
jgi:arylsulfatase A-like enzyme